MDQIAGELRASQIAGEISALRAFLKQVEQIAGREEAALKLRQIVGREGAAGHDQPAVGGEASAAPPVNREPVLPVLGGEGAAGDKPAAGGEVPAATDEMTRWAIDGESGWRS